MKVQTAPLVPLVVPELPDGLSNQELLFGPYVHPIDRIKLYSDKEFERFIQEWLHGLKEDYHQVVRCGGAGDLGRDVVAYVTDPTQASDWDNYQCKHYDHQLAPGDIWLELGKLTYYTYKKRFTLPRKYYFIAPQGVGPSLLNLLENPSSLRDGLIDQWASKCKASIAKGQDIPLSGDMLAYVKAFDFKIVWHRTPLEIVEQHRRTDYYAPRFGGGLTRRRPAPPSPPNAITQDEARYVEQLMAAYQDHLKKPVKTVDCLAAHPMLKEHLHRSRESFYRAESLRQFSRDATPDETCFQDLQTQVHYGVVDTADSNHPDGLCRVRETCKAAASLQITTNILSNYLRIEDRHGICHQLANDDRLTWVKE